MDEDDVDKKRFANERSCEVCDGGPARALHTGDEKKGMFLCKKHQKEEGSRRWDK